MMYCRWLTKGLAVWFGLVNFCASPSIQAYDSFESVKQRYQTSEGVLLDRNNLPIHEGRINQKSRRLSWVALERVSPTVVKNLIQIEDKRFYEHSGIDYRALGASLYSAVRYRRPVRGASTITMQLAGLLDKDLRPGNSVRRSVWKKVKQAWKAREIEKRWTKDQILEAYLNLVTFKGEIQGLSAASWSFYDKGTMGLDDEEAYILILSIRSPNSPIEKVIERGCGLLSAFEKSYSCRELQSVVDNNQYRIRQGTSLAPHVFRMLVKKPEAVRSTLDAGVQKFALQSLQQQLQVLQGKNVRDRALSVIEKKTGNVLAYVGNGGDFSSARYVDGIRALRQAGSTLKPFIYEQAIEKKYITAQTTIEDSPLDLFVGRGVYHPSNYDKTFHGLVSARNALSSSMNVPAVKVLMLVGVEPAVGRLRELGLSHLEYGEFYGPSLALGSADITLWELANAYRTLANQGRYSELRFLPAKDEPVFRNVMQPQSAYIVSQILSDRASRATTFGLENPLAGSSWMAVKTGTSKDMRDNWCVGYSDRYTVGVWVGNFQGDPMWDVSGVTGAAPLWADVMNYLHRNDPSQMPALPSGVVQKEILDHGSKRDEYFLAGTEPRGKTFAMRDETHQPRITYPVTGLTIALDPDIPRKYERVLFEAQNADQKLFWVLNGKRIGSGKNSFSWMPQSGRYLLALVDAKNRKMDEVSFVVKGSRQ